MSQQFKLPELGENIATAGVLSVLVKEGDTISADTPVLEIETDKATVEVPSNVAGKISKIHVKAGEKASVGQVVLTLEDSAAAPEPKNGEPNKGSRKDDSKQAGHNKDSKPAERNQDERNKAPKQAEPTAPASSKSSGPVEVKLPDLGENIAQAKVLQLLVKVGDKVTADTPILELETDKATLEVPSGQAGTVKQIHLKAGDVAKVGQLIATLEGTPSERGKKTSPEGPPSTAPTSRPQDLAPLAVHKPKTGNGVATPRAKAAPASPTVRRLAREIGVDVNTVKGSGPNGRISHEDIKAHARGLLKRQPSPAPQSGGAPYIPLLQLPDFSKFGATEREAISGIRKKTAQQMALAWSTVPMVTQFDKADVTDLEKLRQKLDVKAKKQGNKLTVTAILIRVVASALKLFPKFNASLDLAKEEVVFKKYYNVGVAVDTERGLLVPVVKDVDKKNVFQLSADLQALAEKARTRKVSPDDLQGSCFTITNLGGIGGTSFTPIVNPPEVGILGVSRSSIEPLWQDNAFVPRNILPLSLSYDHRLVDGADAARFLRFVCEALENPALLIFEG